MNPTRHFLVFREKGDASRLRVPRMMLASKIKHHSFSGRSTVPAALLAQLCHCRNIELGRLANAQGTPAITPYSRAASHSATKLGFSSAPREPVY